MVVALDSSESGSVRLSLHMAALWRRACDSAHVRVENGRSGVRDLTEFQSTFSLALKRRRGDVTESRKIETRIKFSNRILIARVEPFIVSVFREVPCNRQGRRPNKLHALVVVTSTLGCIVTKSVRGKGGGEGGVRGE